MYLVPLSDYPLQTQNFTHEGYDLTLTVRWNSVGMFWNMDLFDNINQVTLTQGEGLSMGAATCAHLDLPFVFVLYDEAGIGEAVTDITDMGVRANVYIMSRDEYNDTIW